MYKLELCHADTCLPDYWSGHHRAHLQIPVYKGMTLKAIKQALKDEIRQGAVMGTEHLAYILSSGFVLPEEEKEARAATRATYAAINRMKPAKKGQRTFFRDIESCDAESDYSVCAFFVFMPLE